MNSSAETMFGYKSDECIGKNLHQIFHHTKPDGSPYGEDDCPTQMVLRGKKGSLVKNEIFWRKDGSGIPVECTSFALNDFGNVCGAIVICKDLTKEKKLEKDLHATHSLLINEQLALRKKDAALAEIMNHSKKEQLLLKSNIQANISRVALPAINKIRAAMQSQDSDYIAILDVLEKCLNDIASSFVGDLLTRKSSLTPREIEISNMIKNGLTSKEIAVALNISPQTVNLRRKIIRKKLKITNKKINLSSYLQKN
jgi:PAS domain S-box-containing protein